MIIALTYVSLIAGGLLLLILLLGIVGGMDFDFDLDFDGADQTDVGFGVGMVKGGLTFVSIGAWVLRLLLLASLNPFVAVVVGAGAGAVAVYLMVIIFKWMMRFEENVNWKAGDALMQSGKVYLRIPAQGEGLVRINLKGGVRELKAKSTDGIEIPTGAAIFVDDVNVDGLASVSTMV